MKTTSGKMFAVLVPLLFALPASAYFYWPIGGPITRCAEGHGYNACDIAGPNGYRVGTSRTGYYHSKLSDPGGYGNYAMVRHPDTCGGTDYYTLYAHLSSFTGYAIGTQLVRGAPTGTEADGMDSVGYEGSTGNSTGPHVHFEIRRGSTKLYFPGSGTVNKNTAISGTNYSCI